MQTNVTQTSLHDNSLFVYENNVLPNLSDRQRTVLNALRYKVEATCSEIACYLGVPHHTISGRIGELRKKGLIEEVGNKMINDRPHAILKAI